MSGLYTGINVASAFSADLVDFSVGDDASGPYRVSDFTWVQRLVGDPQAKMQGAGQWPTHRDVRVLEIAMEGTLVGGSPSDYWAYREALMKAVVPPEDYDRSVYYHSVLTVTMPGLGDVYADVVLADWSMPTAAAMGSASRYQFTWHADAAYWKVPIADTIVRI